MTRRLSYILIAVQVSILIWAGLVYGIASLVSTLGDEEIDPNPTAGTE